MPLDIEPNLPSKLKVLTQFDVYSSSKVQSSENQETRSLLHARAKHETASNAILLQRRLVVKGVFVMGEGVLLTTARRIY